MADREDNTLRNVAVGAGAAVAGVVAADQVVRARARGRLGLDFSPDGTARVSPAARQDMVAAAGRVSPSDVNAVREFAGGKSWLANRFLRSGEMVDVKQGQVIPVSAGEQAKRLPAYNAMIDSVQRAATSGTLPAGSRMFRGTGTTSLGASLKPGSTFSDKGFQFGSTNLRVAEIYHEKSVAKGRPAAIMVIDTGGAKGLNLEANSRFSDLNPVILPKDTTLRVDRVEKGVRRHLFDAKRDYVFASVEGAGQSRPAPAVASVARQIKTDVVRAVLPRAVRQRMAAIGMIGKIAEARESGRTAQAEVFKKMMGQYARGDGKMFGTGLNTGRFMPLLQRNTSAWSKVSAGSAALATAASAGLAYASAKADGKGEIRAVGEGAAAGAASAALPLAGAGAAKMAVATGLVGKSAMALAAKAALPLSVAGTAGYYGWRAMQEGKGVSSVGKAAAWGALNGVIPVDLAMKAYGAVKSSSGSTANARPANLSPEQKQAFQSLNERFASAGPQPDQQASGEGKRGWANPATQRAAQEARGVAKFTDWAKS